MTNIVVVRGKDISSWNERKIKEKIRRLCKSEGVELLVFVSE